MQKDGLETGAGRGADAWEEREDAGPFSGLETLGGPEGVAYRPGAPGD